MPRLFIGLEIAPSQRSLLSLLQSGLSGARWVEMADLHLTLRFIGDVSPKEADALVEALDAGAWPAPTISINGLAAFGGSQPTSIHARVGPDDTLLRLQAKLERLIQRLGHPADRRKFTPHITLARLNNVRPEAVAHFLGNHGGFSCEPFQPTSLVLYSARESRGGGPYHVEERFGFIG